MVPSERLVTALRYRRRPRQLRLTSAQARSCDPIFKQCRGGLYIHPHIFYRSSLNVTRLISRKVVSPLSTFFNADWRNVIIPSVTAR